MKLACSLFAALSLTMTASGAIVTYNDFKYYGNNPGPTAKGSDFGNEDVFGFLRSFDIEKATIETTGTSVRIDLFYNYGQTGGDTSLGDYTSSSFPTVFPADVLMFIAGNWYAIPLVDHNATTRDSGPGSLIANTLYITGDPLSAQQVTGQEDPSTRYQPSVAVWADPLTSTPYGAVAQRTITGPFGSQIKVSLLLNDASFATLVNDNLATFVLNFSSATCGNDVLIGIGQFDEVPEPVTTALVGAGLLALAVLRRRQ